MNKVTNWQRFWYLVFLCLIIVVPYNYGFIKARLEIVESCTFNKKFYYPQFQIQALEYKYLVFECPTFEVK